MQNSHPSLCLFTLLRQSCRCEWVCVKCWNFTRLYLCGSFWVLAEIKERRKNKGQNCVDSFNICVISFWVEEKTLFWAVEKRGLIGSFWRLWESRAKSHSRNWVSVAVVEVLCPLILWWGWLASFSRIRAHCSVWCGSKLTYTISWRFLNSLRPSFLSGGLV